MFQIDDDMTIYITRGDVAYFSVTADNNGVPYKFQPGDVVRIKVFAKKDATNVAFQKDFPVLEESEKVDILLTETETKIGDVISKPVDYWYEIELNPYSNPQTIVGYDDDGAKIFKLFPEGKDLGPDTVPEDVPVVDAELSLTSQKPIENQAVTRAIVKLSDDVKSELSNHSEALAKVEAEVEEAVNKTYAETDKVSREIAVERARIDNLAKLEAGSTTGDAELIDARVGADGVTYASTGAAVRGQITDLKSDLSEIENAMAKEKVDIAITLEDGYMKKDGTVNPNLQSYYHTQNIECVGIKEFFYTGYGVGSSMWVAVFFDSDNNVVETQIQCDPTKGKDYVEEPVTVPRNASYVVFNHHSARSCSVYYEELVNIGEELANIGEELAEMNEKILDNGNWSHIKWACVGDSLTARGSRTTKHYHDYVAEKTGIEVVNMGDSGTGYGKGSDTNRAFYQRIENVPLDTDVVTIFGSGNDGSIALEIGKSTDTGTETLCGCINTTIDNLYAILPTIQLGIVTPTPWVGNEPSNNGFMARYSEAIVEICKRRGIPCLDLFHCSGLRPNDANYRELVYSKDEGNGVHPNELGHKIISSHFYNFLQSLIGTY